MKRWKLAILAFCAAGFVAGCSSREVKVEPSSDAAARAESEERQQNVQGLQNEAIKRAMQNAPKPVPPRTGGTAQ